MSTKEDFRSSITVIEPSAPTPSRSGKVVFIGRSKLGLTPVTIATESDIATNINDDDASEVFWTDTAFIFCPITDSTDLQSQLDLVVDETRTFIFSSYATGEAILASVQVKNGAKVYTSANLIPWDNASLVALAAAENTCVFIDPELEGKPFYSFIDNISSFPVIGNFIGLQNSAFSSTFTSVAVQELMVSNNFSYWFEPTESATAECNDVYIGGKQAQVFYEYLAIEESVKSVIYNFTKEGNTYTDNNLTKLSTEMSASLNSLVAQNIIETYAVNVPTVAEQTISDKVKGIVYGYIIEFDELYRIAKVNITIEGVL